jgi:hypothetical protein
LRVINYIDLDVSVAHPKIKTIPAGKVFSIVIEISVENSIICINFQTELFDIYIGLYKASPISRYEKITIDGEDDEIDHPLERATPLQEIQSLKQVDSSTAKTINYIATEPGFYKLVFSNRHSWIREKVLSYRYCVLRPTDS